MWGRDRRGVVGVTVKVRGSDRRGVVEVTGKVRESGMGIDKKAWGSPS